MNSNTGDSLVHLALQVVLLVGMTAGCSTRSIVKLESPLLSSWANQEPPKCIYSHDGPPTELPRIMYPLYYNYPEYDNVTGVCTDEFIKNLSKGCRSILAVVNPNTGPAAVGSRGYNGYQACTRMMDKNGVQMVGYVKTKIAHVLPTGVWEYTGVRDFSDIARDIDSWYDHFSDIPNFNGIFVDETSTYFEITTDAFGVNNTAFYHRIINYIKKKWKNSVVVLNPGSFTSTKLLTPAPDFLEPADISIPWEDYAYHWRPENDNCSLVQRTPDFGNFGIGPWCKFVPVADHVEDFKNGVSTKKYSAAAFLHSNTWGIDFAINSARLAAFWNFTFYYSTDHLLEENPWKDLPSYWEKYLEFLHQYAFVKVTHPVNPELPRTPVDPNPTRLNLVYGYEKFSCPYDWKSKLHPNFPDMFNCNNYYSCYGDNRFYHLTCEKLKHFDPVSGKCVTNNVMPCIQYSTPKDTPFVCPVHWKKDPNHRYAYTQNYREFYTCSDKGVTHDICSGDLVFDCKTRLCVPKDQTSCVQPNIPVKFISNQNKHLSTADENNIKPFTCPFNWEQDANKFYADIYNCNMFYTCGPEIAHTKCAAGKRFDPILRDCGPMESVPCVEAAQEISTSTAHLPFTCPFNWQRNANKFYADIYDCNMFYTCGDNITYTKCTANQRFNPITRFCAPEEKTPCVVVVKKQLPFTCPSNWKSDANKYYVDIYDCTMFYTCGDNITHTKCAANQRFNPITRFCVAPNQVPCYQAL